MDDPIGQWLAEASWKQVLDLVADLAMEMGYTDVISLRDGSQLRYHIMFYDVDADNGTHIHAAHILPTPIRTRDITEVGPLRRDLITAREGMDLGMFDGIDPTESPLAGFSVVCAAELSMKERKAIQQVFGDWPVRLIDGRSLRALVADYMPGRLTSPARYSLRPLVSVVSNISPQLLRILQEEPARLRDLSPSVFEELVADRLDKMGYEVTLTGATHRKDGGVDLIATPRDAGAGTFLIAGQVKHHSREQKTGRAPVDRLLSMKNSYFRVGLLVTNTTFTKDAQWAAALGDNKFFARLRDIEDIRRWLHEDFSADQEFRELPPEVELAPGVKVKVPRPTLPKSMTKGITLK